MEVEEVVVGGEQLVSQPAKLQPCGPGEVGAAVRRALSSQTIVICINHIARGVHGVKVFKCLQGWVLVDYMLSLREVVIIVQCRLLRYLLFTYDDLHCRVFFFLFLGREPSSKSGKAATN